MRKGNSHDWPLSGRDKIGYFCVVEELKNGQVNFNSDPIKGLDNEDALCNNFLFFADRLWLFSKGTCVFSKVIF